MAKHNTSQNCRRAAANLSVSLDAGARLPGRVFAAHWADFHLFDPDWIFEGAFVGQAHALLSVEGASCACLQNLDKGEDDPEARFMIHDQTTSKDFQARLSDGGPGVGWIYDFDRFGCMSDSGAWCIYCERASELALIGFASDSLCYAYDAVLKSLRAERVASFFYGRSDSRLQHHLISLKWQSAILQHYR